MWEVLSRCAFLEHGLCLDLQEFEFDQIVIRRQITQAGKRFAGIRLAIVVDKPSRRERLVKE
jgi:hypothetical protein